MSNKEFFPERAPVNPTIYAYELREVNSHVGQLKVGFTDRDAFTRVSEQLKTSAVKYNIVFETSAMRNDGSSFTDRDVHRILKKKGIANPEGEWFKCTVKDIEAAVLALKTGIDNEDNRTLSFGMRPEQEQAVDKAIAYFSSSRQNTTFPMECQNAFR